MPALKNLDSLVINKVESQEVYEWMKANNKTNEDELYLTPDSSDMTVDSALSSTSTNPVQNKVVKAAIDGFIDTIYPLGSIYMTTSNTNPMTLFPNTYWLPIYNKFLLGAGDTYKAGSTGGEAVHTLTLNEMPNHAHSIFAPNAGGPEEGAALGFPMVSDKQTWWAEASKTGVRGGGTGAKDGEAQAHNNMPPYFAVCIWRRVTFQEYEAGL